MKLFELAYACRLYPYFGGFDKSLTTFHQATGSVLDVNNPDHCVALLEWLNSWGCRQFAKKDHKTASRSLVEWSKDYIDKLPPKDVGLLELTEVHLNSVAQAYGALKDRTASTRSGKSVGFGPTGTAKVLFVLRPHAFAPWDTPIRERFEYDESEDSYLKFLGKVKTEIQELVRDAARFSIQPSEIPSNVNRAGCTLPKLIDEYNWLIVTKKVELPNREELEKWTKWAFK